MFWTQTSHDPGVVNHRPLPEDGKPVGMAIVSIAQKSDERVATHIVTCWLVDANILTRRDEDVEELSRFYVRYVVRVKRDVEEAEQPHDPQNRVKVLRRIEKVSNRYT